MMGCIVLLLNVALLLNVCVFLIQLCRRQPTLPPSEPSCKMVVFGRNENCKREIAIRILDENNKRDIVRGEDPKVRKIQYIQIRVWVKYSTCTWYLYLSTNLSVLDVLEYLVYGNAKVLALVLVLDQKVLGTYK